MCGEVSLRYRIGFGESRRASQLQQHLERLVGYLVDAALADGPDGLATAAAG